MESPKTLRIFWEILEGNNKMGKFPSKILFCWFTSKQTFLQSEYGPSFEKIPANVQLHMDKKNVDGCDKSISSYVFLYFCQPGCYASSVGMKYDEP